MDFKKYKKEYLIILIFVILVITLFAVIIFNNKNKDCDSIVDQDTRDDCYHAFAHEKGDRTICSKISDSEKKEHCLGHIPE